VSRGGYRDHGIVGNLYRWTLYLLPGEFRTRYALQMLQAFRDTSDAVRAGRGVSSATRAELRMLAELLIGLPREHLQSWKECSKRAVTPSLGEMSSATKKAPPLGPLIQDLRYAFRRVSQSPGFSFVAVFTLAVGIGANTAIFSLVNAVLIRNRPYRAPQELVHVYSKVEGRSAYANTSYQDLLELRGLDDVFDAVGAYAGRMSRVMENDGAVPVFIEAVTQNLFPLLGLEPRLGRVFLPEEDVVPGNHPVAILGYGRWQRSYAEAPDIIGKSITLGGRPFTIVGVMPESFESLMVPGVRTDVFVPMKMAAALSREGDEGMYFDRTAQDVKVIGRLRSDVRPEYASVRIDGLSDQLKAAFPDVYEDRTFNVVPTLDVVIQPDFDRVLLLPIAALLMAMVGLVLMLTCTNLASLLLARGADRAREVAVRCALGAYRIRLVSQFLTETMVLGVVGCFAGLLLAHWLLNVLTAIQPPFWVPIDIDHSLDSNVLLFSLCVTALAGLLAGVAPALRSTSPNVAPVLRGEHPPIRHRHFDLRNVLIGLQIVVSVVLLVAGGLFLRSLQEARNADPGFATQDAGVVWLDLGVSGIPMSEWSSTTEKLVERARALPGVNEVGVSNGIPLAVGAGSGAFDIPGVEPPEDYEHHHVRIYCIDQNFFPAMGIDLIAGRGIRGADRFDTDPVLVVSEAAARRFWPGEDPLGRSVFSTELEQPMRVVGVARDIKLDRLDEAPQPLFYLAAKQHAHRADNVLLVARGNAPAAEIAANLRHLVRSVDAQLVVMTVSSLREQFSVMLFPYRAAAGLLVAFGTLALVLAAIGLYGAVSFAVSRKTREVGIRMSLGAKASNVIWSMIKDILVVVAAAVFLGVLAAVSVARFLHGFLIGVEPFDMPTLVCVPILLLSVAFVAAFVPARRASRACPSESLRTE